MQLTQIKQTPFRALVIWVSDTLIKPLTRPSLDNAEQLEKALRSYRTLIDTNHATVERMEAQVLDLEIDMENLDDETAQAEIIADGLERLLGHK